MSHKKLLLTIIALGIGLSMAVVLLSALNRDDHSNQEATLSATIATTSATDTIGTFRTNVNTSLENINNAISGFASVGSSSINGALGPFTFSGGTYVGISTSTNAVTFANLGVQSLTAGSGVNVTSATGTVTVANIGVTSIVASSSVTVSNATGTVTIAMRPVNAPWTIEAPTGTLATAASCTSGFCLDHIFTFDSTSTIVKVRAKNKAHGDTIQFNLYYATSTKAVNSTSSMSRVFTSDQTQTSTSTPTVYTPNGQVSPPLGAMLFIGYRHSSTTQTHWDTYFNYTP